MNKFELGAGIMGAATGVFGASLIIHLMTGYNPNTIGILWGVSGILTAIAFMLKSEYLWEKLQREREENNARRR